LSAPAAAVERRPGGRSIEILERSGGRLEVRGALTFATARRARQLGLRLLSAAGLPKVLEVDCSGVTESDSAGLAVLLDWLACARGQDKTLHLRHLPAPIIAVAQISEVTELLESPG
jgi:phospholipid transport system transporter-binding protein